MYLDKRVLMTAQYSISNIHILLSATMKNSCSSMMLVLLQLYWFKDTCLGLDSHVQKEKAFSQCHVGHHILLLVHTAKALFKTKLCGGYKGPPQHLDSPVFSSLLKEKHRILRQKMKTGQQMDFYGAQSRTQFQILVFCAFAKANSMQPYTYIHFSAL